MASATIKVTQTRSTIGILEKHKATMRGLGLRLSMRFRRSKLQLCIALPRRLLRQHMLLEGIHNVVSLCLSLCPTEFGSAERNPRSSAR